MIKVIMYLAILMFVWLAATSCTHKPFRRDYVCTTTHTTFGRGTRTTDTIRSKTQEEIDHYMATSYINNDSVFHQVICK